MTIKIRFSVQLGLLKSRLSPLAARPCHNVSLAKIWYCRNVVAEKILCIYCVIYPLFYTNKIFVQSRWTNIHNTSCVEGLGGYGVQQYFSYIVAVSFISGGNKRTQRKPTDLSQVTDKLYHIMLY
jgi:hypothetical protein